MVWAPLCPSSGAREYYTDGRCLWYLVLWFSSCRYDVDTTQRNANVAGAAQTGVCCSAQHDAAAMLKQQPANRTHNLQLHIIPTT